MLFFIIIFPHAHGFSTGLVITQSEAAASTVSTTARHGNKLKKRKRKNQNELSETNTCAQRSAIVAGNMDLVF